MTPAITVHRLTAAREADFLRFFDHERGPAFADNPAWAKCYCHYYHVPKALDWGAFTAEDNRRAMAARIEVGEMEGFLAYADGEVVGWMNAQPRHKLQHACARLGIEAPEPCVPAQDAAAIVCFVIASAWRRRGIARALLDAALASFAARGIRVVDAYPFKAGPEAKPADHYHGPPSLFRAAGFTFVAEGDDVTVMRRELAPPAR